MKTMITFEDARRRILDAALEPRVETIALGEALGRVLLEDVRLDRDCPGFDRATMDGYAVAPVKGQDTYPVVGVVHAGESPPELLDPGTAIRIMTGAPCPSAVAVIPIEKTDGGKTKARVNDTSMLVVGRNIAKRGEDGHEGDVILKRGHRLAPASVAAAAMAGKATLSVQERPRVGIVTTGDEVGAAGPAGIHDSNGPYLCALMAAAQTSFRRWHAKDREDELRSTLKEAGEESDVLVTVGGVSMGAKDLVPSITEQLGYAPQFHKVQIQPGKPVYFARHKDGRCLLGLPGNPVSVIATSHLFLLPLLFGGTTACLDPLQLPLRSPYHHRGRRRLFLPSRWTEEGVEAVRWNGSGDLLAATYGDGLIDLPSGTEYPAGTHVPFYPYLGGTPGSGSILPARAPREVS